MTAPPGKDESRDSPFRIMDEIIYQINKTKKMFIMMIVTIMVIVPVSIVIIFATFGPPFGGSGGGGAWWWQQHQGGPPGPPAFSPAFDAVRILITVVVLVWLVLGIRQWFVLSKWTNKYKIYKELQKKIESKLDFEKGEGEDDEEEGRGSSGRSD
ncbi:MAG TPA: hypothetical protein VF016_10420 [Nitrososphaera sp.]